MTRNHLLYDLMMEHFRGDPRRCQHLIKVASLARQLAEGEGAEAELLDLVEAAGLIHDCGIKPGEAKYGAGHAHGRVQELEGPPVARPLLEQAGFPPEQVERICYLVGHHHTYTNIDGLDYQLLVEADFLVNFYEDELPKEKIAQAVEKIFRTQSGLALAKMMFDL